MLLKLNIEDIKTSFQNEKEAKKIVSKTSIL